MNLQPQGFSAHAGVGPPLLTVLMLSLAAEQVEDLITHATASLAFQP